MTTSILSKQRKSGGGGGGGDGGPGGGGGASHQKREKMQQHLYPEHYLTEEDWSNIQSDNLTVSSKASVIIRRLRLIGLNTPSETTYVHIVALMYCANTAHYVVNANPVTALATVRDVKVLFKSWNPRVGSFMYDFPMSPDDLKKVSAAVFESAYKEGPPVASRVDPAAMKLLTENIPARKSRATVTSPLTTPVKSGRARGAEIPPGYPCRPTTSQAWSQEWSLLHGTCARGCCPSAASSQPD